MYGWMVIWEGGEPLLLQVNHVVTELKFNRITKTFISIQLLIIPSVKIDIILKCVRILKPIIQKC